MIPLSKRAAVFAIAALLTGLCLYDFCNWVFACGCQSFWRAGAEHCNIHHGPKHCPWCTHGGAGFVVSGVVVMLAQGWIAFRAAGPSLLVRLALCLAAFPVLGGLVAWFVGFSQGYWSP